MSHSDLINADTVRKFIALVHERAANALSGTRRPGLLQLVSISPDDRGMSYSPFAIGDVDRMVEAVLIDAANRNVYIETRTVRPGRPKERRPGRGKADATIGTFAIVIDSDGDRGRNAYIDRIGRIAHIDGGASAIVETSPPDNRHIWLFLDRAVSADAAERLGKLVRKSVGGDHCSGVITQPFRVPGTPNYPDAKKRARGRVVVPTRLISISDRLWTLGEVEATFSTDGTQAAKPQPTRKAAGALKQNGPSPSIPRKLVAVRKKLAAKITGDVDRSAEFQSAGSSITGNSSARCSPASITCRRPTIATTRLSARASPNGARISPTRWSISWRCMTLRPSRP